MDDKQKEIEELKRQRDEFRLELITRAGELQGMAEEKDELVRERDALAARTEQLYDLVRYLMDEHEIPASDYIKNELLCAPAKSLNHIKKEYYNKGVNDTKFPLCACEVEELEGDEIMISPCAFHEQWLDDSKAQIAAQVEEETIERCVALIQDDPNTYRDGSDIALENMPRKYAKQAGSTVEDNPDLSASFIRDYI